MFIIIKNPVRYDGVDYSAGAQTVSELLARRLIVDGLAVEPSSVSALPSDAGITNMRTRIRMLGFGCSISQMDQDFAHAATTTVAGETKAGSATLNVASGAGFSDGDWVIVPLYTSQLWKTQITVSGNTLTPATPTPQLIRAAATVTKSAYANGNADVDRSLNIVGAAVALLGGSVELVNGYGYGGAQAGQMISDFISWFNFYRPHICTFHLSENDWTTSESGVSTVSQVKGITQFMAQHCVNNDCVPVVFSSVPYTLIGSSRAAAYDEYLRWVVYDLPKIIPGAIGADASTKWLDKSNPTHPRSPIAGWTDNVHPNVNKRFAVGMAAGVPALAGVLPPSRSLAYMSVNPITQTRLEGTGGTNSSMDGASVIPAGYNFSRFGTVATMKSTRNADGSLHFLCTWPSGQARSRSVDTGYFRALWTFQPSMAGSGQYFRVYARFAVRQNVEISQLYPSVIITGNETYAANTGVDFMESCPEGSGIICLETPAFTLHATAVSLTIGMFVSPKTNASPANDAVCEFDLYELGMIPVHSPKPVA